MLSRFGLQFIGCAKIWNHRHVDVADIVAPNVFAHLANGFQEDQTLDVADCSTDFNNHNFCLRMLGALRRGNS